MRGTQADIPESGNEVPPAEITHRMMREAMRPTIWRITIMKGQKRNERISKSGGKSDANWGGTLTVTR
jgi:hypothetical protein